jgi:hypothetical protein
LIVSTYHSTQADIVDRVLPTSGTYTIFSSDYGGNNTGSYWLSLQCREDIMAKAFPISYDTLVTDSITPYGDMDAWTFTGSEGDSVIIRMRETSGNFDPMLELFGPDNTLIVSTYHSTQADIVDRVLPTSGTYTIFSSDYGGNNTGSYWLSLQCREDIMAKAISIPCDTLVEEESINPYGDMDAYTFTGGAGGLVTIRMRETSGNFNPMLELFGPDNTLIVSTYHSTQADIVDRVLPTSGTYTIFSSDYGGNNTGSYWLSLQCRFFPDIFIIKPNGGEHWRVDSTYNITWWNSSGIDSVMIEYTTDGGFTWLPIEDKTPSDGSYSWTVPNTPSDSCLVRICDIDDSLCDQSDSFFTITVENVTIITPNGGENWCAGDTETINWSSIDVDSVKIDYSTDGGANWTSITQKWPSHADYPWPVPEIFSDSCLVRVCDIDDSPCDQSDSFFSISTKSLTLLSPNGGQSWLEGDSQSITWESNCVENVNIEYTIDGGSSWIDIDSNVVPDGSYTWEVPDTPSDSCLIRICDTDGTTCDTSDSFFTITRQSITLDSPNGGENWCVGDTQLIVWNSTYVESVVILYSIDDGSSWDTVVSCTTNVNHYSWKVPDTPSTLCRVKVCDCDGNPCDESDSNFSILTKPYTPTLVSPDSGATDVSVDPTHFEWNPSSWADSYWLQVDDDSTFTNPEYDSSGIDSTNQDVNGLSCDTIYYWRVKAINICDTSVWSDTQYFTTIPTSVRVISPNGGENWCAGSSQHISWDCSCIDKVKIEYTANGTSWSPMVDSTQCEIGSYLWAIPSDLLSSSTCKVKISDVKDGDPSDISEGNFTITAQSIVIGFPNSVKDTLYEQRADTIAWSCSCFSDPVRIDYSTDGGNNWIEIVGNTPNDEWYVWTAPSDVNSNACKIKISDAIDGIPFDESDENFTIVATLATLVELYPGPQESVSYRSPITLTFSRTMDVTTFNTYNISIQGVDNFIYDWDSVRTSNHKAFEIPLSNGFRSLDTVAIELKGTIRDSLGRCFDINENGVLDDCDTSKRDSFYVYPLGDYTHDMVVNGDDVPDFTSAWNTLDTSKDIGPATGTPPHLLATPDGKLDFEDLVIFVWMWNWFHQKAYPSPSIYAGDKTTDFDNLIAFTPDSLIGQNESKEFGLVLKGVKDVMVVSIVLEYDPAKLKIECVDEGSLLSQDGANTLFLRSIDNDRGIAEIACSRLKGDPPGVEGEEPVDEIQVKSLMPISSEPITVYYKIWNPEANIIASGKSHIELSSEGPIPEGYQLFQNYPNPFNAVTQIKYALPKDCKIKLTIYNILGQRVKTLVDEQQSAGYKNISWDGTDETGNEVSSGIYFYGIETDEFAKIYKMVILK